MKIFGFIVLQFQSFFWVSQWADWSCDCCVQRWGQLLPSFCICPSCCLNLMMILSLKFFPFYLRFVSRPMAGPGSSMLYSFLLFTVILSLQESTEGSWPRQSGSRSSEASPALSSSLFPSRWALISYRVPDIFFIPILSCKDWRNLKIFILKLCFSIVVIHLCSVILMEVFPLRVSYLVVNSNCISGNKGKLFIVNSLFMFMQNRLNLSCPSNSMAESCISI